METLQLIADARILPTLKLPRAEDAPPLFAALCSGGINAALVSIHSDDTPAILRQGSRLFPDLLLGADGIASTEDTVTAIRSGARIVATNGYSREIARICADSDAFYLPFCLSPSELLAHRMNGGEAAGIFSPETFGKTEAVEAFAAAFPRLPLICGNIPLEKIGTYLADNAVIAVTCPDIAEGSLDEVIVKCREASAAADS